MKHLFSLKSAIIAFSLFLVSCSELGENIVTPLPISNSEADNPKPIIKVFTNPLLNNGEVTWDPSIIKEGDTYYAFSTKERWADGKEPVIGVFKSKDMVTWTFVDEAAPGASGWLRGIHVFKSGDKFVLYAFDGGIHVFTSFSAAGPYTKEATIALPNGVVLSGDGFANFIQDGDKSYLVAAFEKGIGLLPMKNYFEPADGAALTVLTSESTLQNPTIQKYKDNYYLFVKSKNYWDNGDLLVLKSSKIDADYVDKNGAKLGTKVLGKGAKLQFINGISGFVLDAANDAWIYYSAGLSNGGSNFRLCLDKLVWDDEKYPYVSNYTPSEVEQKAPVIK